MEWEIIQIKKFLGCPGSIYIDLIHELSGKILSQEVLWNFCNELKEKLADRNWYELSLSYDDNGYSFGNIAVNNNRTWIKMYYSRVDEMIQCDEVKPIIEYEVKKTLIENWSYTCGNIYARIIQEICSINRNPKVLKDFCNDLYNLWEEDNVKDFYINANLGNITISNQPEDIEDPTYDKENHYYHFYVDENENANFVEIENKCI